MPICDHWFHACHSMAISMKPMVADKHPCY